jgi:ribosomal protein L16 Arg81 hydroxylase
MLSMKEAELDFEALISPVDVETFMARHWEAAPLLISRERPDFYSSILSANDLDPIVSMACLVARRNAALQRPLIELVGGPALSTNRDLSAAAVGHAYEAGSTIRIRAVQSYSQQVWSLCAGLEKSFSFPVSANLYITPPHAKGLNRHYDEHDVIVLQVHGRKHWRVLEPITRLPLENPPLFHFEGWQEMRDQRLARDEGEEISDLAVECEGALESGDLLYVPRGHYHEAWTSDLMSAHLSVGILSITWADLLSAAVGQVSERDERFRKALPPGFINDPGSEKLLAQFGALLESFSLNADINALVAEAAARFISARQVIGGGALTDAAARGGIDLNTLVEKRPGLINSIVVEAEQVGLSFYDRVVYTPKFTEPALRFIASRERFRVGDLPGRITDNSKLVLVERLISEGLLRISKERG